MLDLTWKVASPLASVVSLTTMISAACAPPVFARETALLGSGWSTSFFSVTVMVDFVAPSAGTSVLGDATTVELVPSVKFEVKSTLAVSVIGTESPVAVNSSVPTVVELTVKVACPNRLVVAEGGLMLGAPGPAVFARVTVL